MRIKVLCSDKSRGYVKDNELHELIEKGVVVAFFRAGSGEWVDAKKHRKMNKGQQSFKVPDRTSKI